MIKRILFATDFSSCADYAEEYVAFLATTYRAAVHVVHVLEVYEGLYVTTTQDHRETDERVSEVVRRLQPSTALVTHQQDVGIPDVRICRVAMETHTDLIVLGTHGRTGLQHILLGSTAERVLTMAPCPVLTVREPKGVEERHKKAAITFHHVAVPIDFSDCSMDALEYGIRIAKDCGATLTLLHVLEPVSYGIDLTFKHTAEQDRERRALQLNSVAGTIRSQGLSVRELIRGGSPADSIVEFVQATGCDLIAMGTHGRRGISRVVKGSVAEAVLRGVSCPVLAVKTSKLSAHQRRVRWPQNRRQ
ncbi:MAG TPA: universal stress protein [Nitrospiraceae bacterium]|nr:universal stress protein [Nitrospiraceae bacterium]